jgi:hypothetical protein
MIKLYISLKWKKIRIGNLWMRIRVQQNDADPTGSTTLTAGNTLSGLFAASHNFPEVQSLQTTPKCTILNPDAF